MTMSGGDFVFLMILLWSFVGGGISEQKMKGLLYGNVTLHTCAVNKQSVTTVEWRKYKKSQRLLYTFNKSNDTCKAGQCTNMSFDKQTLSLILLNVTAEDEAIYEEKILVNNIPSMRCNISLSLLLPPDALRIAVFSSDYALSLRCEVKGELLKLRWLRDARPLPEDQRISFSENNVTMNISNLTSSDCRMYTCQVSNEAGKSEVHVNISGNITTVCQDNVPRDPAQMLTLYLFIIGLVLIVILGLCITLFCICNYGRRRANAISVEVPIYGVTVHSQEEANAEANPLPYVYMDYIKPKSQQARTEGQLHEDFGYSTIAEVKEYKQSLQNTT